MQSTLKCFVCNKQCNIDKYSKSQLKKKSSRKCTDCISQSKKKTINWIKCLELPHKPCPYIPKKTANMTHLMSTDYTKFSAMVPMCNCSFCGRNPYITIDGIKTHDYDCNTNEWNTGPKIKLISQDGKIPHYLLSKNCETSQIFELCVGSTRTGASILLTNHTTNITRQLANNNYGHQLDYEYDMISCITDNNTLHVIQNNWHYIWLLNHKKNGIINGYYTQIPYHINDKVNGSLFYVKSKNMLLFINGYDNILCYSLVNKVWKWNKWQCEGLKSIGWMQRCVEYQYVMTNSEMYIIIIANVMKGNYSNNCEKNKFFVYDIERRKIVQSKGKGPPNVAYYKGVIMNDAEMNDLRGDLLISGYFGECFVDQKRRNNIYVPMDIMNLIINYGISEESLHLIGHDHSHYKVNINQLL